MPDYDETMLLNWLFQSKHCLSMGTRPRHPALSLCRPSIEPQLQMEHRALTMASPTTKVRSAWSRVNFTKMHHVQITFPRYKFSLLPFLFILYFIVTKASGLLVALLTKILSNKPLLTKRHSLRIKMKQFNSFLLCRYVALSNLICL